MVKSRYTFNHRSICLCRSRCARDPLVEVLGANYWCRSRYGVCLSYSVRWGTWWWWGRMRRSLVTSSCCPPAAMTGPVTSPPPAWMESPVIRYKDPADRTVWICIFWFGFTFSVLVNRNVCSLNIKLWCFIIMTNRMTKLAKFLRWNGFSIQ